MQLSTRKEIIERRCSWTSNKIPIPFNSSEVKNKVVCGICGDKFSDTYDAIRQYSDHYVDKHLSQSAIQIDGNIAVKAVELLGFEYGKNAVLRSKQNRRIYIEGSSGMYRVYQYDSQKLNRLQTLLKEISEIEKSLTNLRRKKVEKQ